MFANFLIPANLPIVLARTILDCAFPIHEYLLPAAVGVWYSFNPNFVSGKSESEEFHMKRTLALLVIGALFITVAPLSAHHSTAMYTGSKTVTGKVLKFEWTNPHAHVYVETKDESGKTVVWDVELMSLNHLRSYGWTAKTVQVGDVVSATGMFAKNGDPTMIASRMKLADGREISS